MTRQLMARRLRQRPDGGFTLVEVMVALTIFAAVSMGTLPLFLSGIRSADLAKLNTQAKNLLQERIEAMRNLPFHVARSAGPYVDLLDIYFRDLDATSTNSRCDSAGYDAATATYTCTLDGSGKLAFPGFDEVVRSQFVDKDRHVVTPRSTYDSQSTAGLDVPPATTLAVTVTVTWTRHGAKSYSSSTVISDTASDLPKVTAHVRVSAVGVEGTVDDSLVPVIARYRGGLIDANTSVSTGASADAQVNGSIGLLTTGETTLGQASGSVDAPPDQTTPFSGTGVPSGGTPCTSDWVCFGPTTVSNVAGTASNGLPTVGSMSAPVAAAVQKSSTGGAIGFWFSNVPTGSVQDTLTRLKVQSASSPPTTSNPTELVRTVQGGGNSGYTVPCVGDPTTTSAADFLTGTGAITTTDGTSHAVTSCATATARAVQVLPTSFAPSGVVQVVLDSARLVCTTDGTTASVTPTYSATVRYWSAALGGYASLTVKPGASDPLTDALLTKSTSTGGVQVGTAPDGTPLWLGDYVQSWSGAALTGGSQSGGRVAQGDLTAVTLSTVPTRDADTNGRSAVTVTVGAVSCLSEDNR